MNFIAIDVETSNSKLSSICQIGLAFFENGKLINSWESLINPEEDFDYINTSIHGITYSDVKESPKFYEIYDELINLMNNNIIVTYMPFDKVAIKKAVAKNNLIDIDCIWIDSAKVVRRTWKDLSSKGYGLLNVANRLNIDFNHHNALEDAKTCGKILVIALDELSMNLTEIQERIKQPIDNSKISLKGNIQGSLHGEVIVFTGSLGISRKEAIAMATKIGCDVSNSVTKKVSILVIGEQDISKLLGYDKSSKQRKAEDLIQKGQNIKIIGESDFEKLVSIE